MSSTSGTPRATTSRSIRRVPKPSARSKSLRTPRLAGAFSFWATFIREKRKPPKVPTPHEIFFAGTREPKPAERFDGIIGLGSMSLILLHHPLFQLDL